MDIWTETYHYDERWGEQEHEVENDLEEGLARVIDEPQGPQGITPSVVEGLGVLPGRVFDLAA